MSDFTGRHCAQCNSPVLRRSARGPRPKYCSAACKEATRRRSRRSLRCLTCGGAFLGNGHSMFCSPGCCRRRKVAADCLVCGNAYMRRRKNTGACSLACGRRLAARRKEQRAPSGECLACGETFRARDPSGSQYCSLRCRRRHDTADRKQRLRSAKVGADFTVGLIAARDGTRCQICGSFIDMKAKWPDPLCASIDHVVPLTRGGAHSFDNAQLAHFACNARKGNRMEVASGT